MTRPRDMPTLLLGVLLLAALLVGGGSAPGLLTDHMLEIAAILIAASLLSAPGAQPVDRRAAAVLALGAAAILLQLVPLPSLLLDRLRPAVLASTAGPDRPDVGFISLGVGRTVELFLFFAATSAFFLAVSRLKPQQVVALLPFFLTGVACNLVAAAIQYSLSSDVSVEGVLPYPISAGVFANVNHFSALLYAAIPLLAYLALFRGRRVVGALGVLAILLLLLAAGSRAGVLIGLAITLLSVLFLSLRGRLGSLLVLATFVAISVYTIGAWTKLSSQELDQAFGRREFALTTLAGIRDNWLLGVGYGNFVDAYGIYERESMIFSAYVNHAHNDYLELVFEGGVVAAVLIACYLALLAWATLRRSRSPLQRAASLAIAFLLVHSLVDYPLRTMALAFTFAFLNAIVFHGGFGQRPRSRPQLEVEHGGRKVLVPIAEPA